MNSICMTCMVHMQMVQFGLQNLLHSFTTFPFNLSHYQWTGRVLILLQSIIKVPNHHSNYRPYNYCSENLIHHKITSFLSEHSKLFPSQHGFCAGHSCQTQLLELFINGLKHSTTTPRHIKMENSRLALIYGINFLDFACAFDAVLHHKAVLEAFS